MLQREGMKSTSEDLASPPFHALTLPPDTPLRERRFFGATGRFPETVHRFGQWMSEQYMKYGPRPKSAWDAWMLLAMLVYVLICMYMGAMAGSYSDTVNINVIQPFSQENVLPDPVIGAFRQAHLVFDRSVADIMLFISFASCFLISLSQRQNSFVVLRRFAFVAGSLTLLRAATVALTVLPNPHPSCPNTRAKDVSVFYDAFLIVTGQRTSCGDIMFSGHTIMYTLFPAMVWKYTFPKWYLRVAGICVFLFCVFAMLSTQLHYTDDVIISIALTFGFWIIVHMTIEEAAWAVAAARGDDKLKVSWWVRFVRNVDDNEYFPNFPPGVYRNLIQDAADMA